MSSHGPLLYPPTTETCVTRACSSLIFLSKNQKKSEKLGMTLQHSVLHQTFWCPNTDNHWRNLIWNCSVHPSEQHLPPRQPVQPGLPHTACSALFLLRPQQASQLHTVIDFNTGKCLDGRYSAHLTLTPGGDDCFLSLHRPTVNPGPPVLEGRWHFCLLKPNLPISEWYSGAELHFRADTPRTEAELTPPFALSRKCCGIHTYTHSCNYTVFLRINNPYNKSPCWGARCVMMVMGRRREEKSSRQIIIRNVCAGPQSSPLTSTICGAQTGNCFSERERELLCCSGSY